MEKQPGVLLFNAGTDVEVINGRRSSLIRTNNQSLIANSGNSLLVSYVNNKCRNFRHFTVGFWLKVMSDNIQNSKVSVRAVSGIGTRWGESSFDKSAVGVWQYVSVPIEIQPSIQEIQLSFGDGAIEGSANREIKIAEARLCYSERSRISVCDLSFYLHQLEGVIVNETTHDISDDFYLTEKDLHSTLHSQFRANGTHYFFSHNNGTRKIAVPMADRATLLPVNAPLEICVVDGSAGFHQQTTSPDGGLRVIGVPYFLKASGTNPDTNFDRVELRVNAIRTADNVMSSAIYATDMHGNIRWELDEYRVRTRYTYDSFGQLSQKEIIASGTNPEVLRFSVESGGNSSTVRSRVNAQQTTGLGANQTTTQLQTNTQINHNTFGMVDSVSSWGGNGIAPTNELTTTTIFDKFKNRLERMFNNAGGGNKIDYDARDRIQKVSPEGMEGASEYEYEFSYNDSNDLSTVKMSHSDSPLVTNFVAVNQDETQQHLTTITQTDWTGRFCAIT